MQRIIRRVADLAAEKIVLEHISTATLVQLPFHLCTGPLFQIVDPDDSSVSIWLRNRINIRHNADIHEEIAAFESRSFKDLCTDALVVNRKPALRAGELEAVNVGDGSGIGTTALKNPGFRFLNELIGAHQIIRLGPYVSGPGMLWPRMLAPREIFERIAVEVILVAEIDHNFDAQLVTRLFENLDQFPFRESSTGFGDTRDYSDDQLEALKLAVRKIRAHAFYELKTHAIAAALRGDYVVAIVLACAALEGVHGTYIRIALKKKTTEDIGNFNRFVNTLLREQGFYSLVQLSVFAFMATTERPSSEDLQRCLNGVTIRNAIMHAGINSAGEYKLRKLSNTELNDGYGGIMAVYRAFESAVELAEER